MHLFFKQVKDTLKSYLKDFFLLAGCMGIAYILGFVRLITVIWQWWNKVNIVLVPYDQTTEKFLCFSIHRQNHYNSSFNCIAYLTHKVESNLVTGTKNNYKNYTEIISLFNDELICICSSFRGISIELWLFFRQLKTALNRIWICHPLLWHGEKPLHHHHKCFSSFHYIPRRF